VVNDDPTTAGLAEELRQLHAIVAELRNEVRAYRADAEHLCQHFDSKHDRTASRLEALEGRKDVVDLFLAGLDKGQTPGIQDTYEKIEGAATRAAQTGKPQRVDIIDAGRRIVARVPPGADPAEVIRDICTATRSAS
jgi:hypothetical protein